MTSKKLIIGYLILGMYFLSDAAIFLANQDYSKNLKLISLVLTLLILYKRKSHYLILLLPIIFAIFFYNLFFSFNIKAGVEELVRYLIPITIAIAFYNVKDYSVGFSNFLLIYILSNNIYGIYSVFAQQINLPLINEIRQEGGLLRLQGWSIYFSAYAYLNFAAYLVVSYRPFGIWLIRNKYWRLFFVANSLFAMSLKIIFVWIFYIYFCHKGHRRYLMLALFVSSLAIAFMLNSNIFDGIISKINYYIVVGDSARYESYRVMFKNIFLDINIFGYGLGSFGGASSIVYNSPLYSQYRFQWYEMEGLLKTVDAFYPHLFVELGLIGAVAYIYFVTRYGLGKLSPVGLCLLIGIVVDSMFSFAMISVSYFITYYVFSVFLDIKK